MTEKSFVYVKGFINGFQVGFTITPDAKREEIEAMIGRVTALPEFGVTPELVGIEAGDKRITITSVIKRLFTKNDGKDATVIDMYPEWGAGGKFGEHRSGFMYIDGQEDITTFEQQSGLKYDSLPLYESGSPIKRIYNRANKNEVAVKTPFGMIKHLVGKSDDGKNRYKYSYATGGTSQPRATQTPMPSQQPQATAQKPVSAIPDGHWVKDNDKRLFVLSECVKIGAIAENTNEALKAFNTERKLDVTQFKTAKEYLAKVSEIIKSESPDW